MIYSPATDETGTSHFGGPVVSEKGTAFDWPQCRHCEVPMQFLGSIVRGTRQLQLFMCDNNPGICMEWEADGGGNAVVVIDSPALETVPPPSGAERASNYHYSAALIDWEIDSYNEAISSWAKTHDCTPRNVLGQLGGEPFWLQADETPSCDQCQQPMTFVAQLEEGPADQPSMNFGGGCGYVFECSCHGSAKLLWQC